jgi:tetratricopeptide (TPR) repeat protein
MDSYTVLGWSYLRLGQYENALTSARNARNEVRYDERIVEIEAEALFFLGRNIESLSLFEEYVSLSPTGQRIDLAYYYMGEIFLRLTEFRHADIAFPPPCTTVLRWPGGGRVWDTPENSWRTMTVQKGHIPRPWNSSPLWKKLVWDWNESEGRTHILRIFQRAVDTIEAHL